MRKTLLAATVVALTIAPLSLVASSAVAAPSTPEYVASALANPARGDDQHDDARRHPGEILTFAEVKPGQKVADLIPGHGYWSMVFSGIVGPSGHVYMIWPKEYASEDMDEAKKTDVLAANPAFPNTSVLNETAAEFSAPEKLDLVFTSQNYHDYPDKFMGHVDPAILNAQVFQALKPGGIYLIVDHVADAGSGMRDTDTAHRIDPAIVKKQVEAAGFKFVGESNVLRNPADTHKLGVYQPEIRGHTDQFIYKFRKP